MKRALLFLGAGLIVGCGGGGNPQNDTGAGDGAMDIVSTDVVGSDSTTSDGGMDATGDAGSSDAGSSDGSGGDVIVRDVQLADVPMCTAPTTPADDPLETMRNACAFQAGARVSDTITDFAAARAAITHVIVIMQENHSMDNMFGHTGHGIEMEPANASNVDTNGVTITAHHEPDACTPNPGAHQWDEMHTAWDNGAMDGFARAAMGDANTAMGYYDDNDHPFYTWLATTFATSDRYFADVLAGTWVNRQYLLMGSRYGGYYTAISCPPASAPTILDRLVAAGIEWGDYVGDGGSGLPFEGSLCYNRRGGTPAEVKTLDDFTTALADGSLPPVSFADLGENIYDEHPPANVRAGEDKVREMVARIMASPVWPHTALFVTYDEGGGFYDHVAPPPSCPPDSAGPASYNDAMDTVYGVRVPLMVVSPYARPGYVSHRTGSHASILRFIEALYDLPALTARDANSAALLDMFDFSCTSFATPPATIPAAGTDTTGCP